MDYLDVLEYFKCHLSMMHPLGSAKIMTFEVCCRAYGGEPSMELFRRFFQTGAAGEWVTIAKRPGASCFLKGGLDIRDWKESFFFVKQSLIPETYPNVVSKANAKVPHQFRDIAPSTVSDKILCERLLKYPSIVQTFPEPILFLTKVAQKWEHDTQEPILVCEGKGKPLSLFFFHD